jgi:DNA-3-methyladenine glycosylase II
MLIQVPLHHTGEFSLDASIGFLEDWPPSAAQTEVTHTLHWAFHAEPGWELTDVVVSQNGPAVTAIIETSGSSAIAAAHTSRILGLDVDAGGFTADAIGDPIVADLIAGHPGLRPTSFWSPYEAAVWAVLSQRVSMVQASRLKQRIAIEHGAESSGFHAFPPPRTLQGIDTIDGVNRIKLDRLHAVAEAAVDGRLHTATLRSLPVDDALGRLRSIPGIGPFSAELILVRGAGHPDVFPSAERRLHEIMRERYEQPDAPVDELARIADAWRPHRSWVSFLFRTSAA